MASLLALAISIELFLIRVLVHLFWTYILPVLLLPVFCCDMLP